MDDLIQSYPMLGARRYEYQHMLNLGTNSVPMVWIDWCKTNCVSDCGWLFIDKKAYMGFESSSDLMWFSLGVLETCDAA